MSDYKTPEGWKLVPVEATPKMVAAYSAAAEDLIKRHHLSGSYPATWQPVEAGYAAMLAAAPTPPVTTENASPTLRTPEPMTWEEISGFAMEMVKGGKSVDWLARAIEAEVMRRVKEANK